MGRVKATVLAVVASAVLAVLLVAFLVRTAQSPKGGRNPELTVYCGAGVKAPVEAAARRYEEEYGVRVILQYGPSQALLAQARVSRKGDLYLPGDDSYLRMAQQEGLVGETFPLARMHVVLAVPQGNPKGVRTLDDVLRTDIKLGQVNPDTAAAGKLTRDALQAAGRWEQVNQHTKVDLGTVAEVADAVRLGSIDAGFVWDVLVLRPPGLEGVALPELAGAQAQVSAGVLHGSSRPEAAAHFARYLAASDRGLRAFRDAGFEPAQGEPWPGTPLPQP
jgi:molybdate transport system substrate-binding protein